MKKEPSLQNKRAVNIANKMGKRYTLLDAMLMGKKLKIDWKKSKFTMGDLLVGMHYELEHGKVDADTNVTNDNALKTAKIAWAHLKERPDYYVQLMKIDPPKKMEKKANSVFVKMEKRGLTPTSVIEARVKNMQLLPADRYLAEGNALVAQSHRNISKGLSQLGKQTGVRDWGNNISSNGATAKRAWDWAVNNVKNPSGKTMEDIRDNAIQKYLSNARASRKYTKASNAVKEYLAKRASDELNDMVKEAAARWRKEWGNLTPEAQAKLRNTIASQTSETAKRMRGQDAMMNKWNIQKTTKPYGPYDKNKFMRWLYHKTGPAFHAGTNFLHDHFSPGENGKPNFKGLKIIDKAGKTNMKKIYRTNRPLYDEIQSIINGSHEIGGEAMIAKQKPMRMQLTNKHFSHFSPEVLHRESAAVATASPEAKEIMKNVRSKKYFAGMVGMANDKTGYKFSDRISEIDDLKRRGGVEYGKDAVVNARKVKNHINGHK